MKILDELVSKIAVLFLGFSGVVLIFLPFDVLRILSLNNITNLFNNIKGNYIYSLIGAIVLLLSIKALFLGVSTSTKRSNYIITPMNFGDLKISDEAIEGLTQNVITRIIGIRSSKISVDFRDEYISIEIKGQVSPDINIPSVTNEIQNKVKDTIESHTGIAVNQINVDILSISSPMKSLK